MPMPWHGKGKPKGQKKFTSSKGQQGVPRRRRAPPPPSHPDIPYQPTITSRTGRDGEEKALGHRYSQRAAATNTGLTWKLHPPWHSRPPRPAATPRCRWRPGRRSAARRPARRRSSARPPPPRSAAYSSGRPRPPRRPRGGAAPPRPRASSAARYARVA